MSSDIDELLASLVDEPHDLELRQILGDRLLEAGEKHGELIALQTAGYPSERANKIARDLEAVIAKDGLFSWHQGFVKSLTVDIYDPVDRHNALALLDTLRVNVMPGAMSFAKLEQLLGAATPKRLEVASPKPSLDDLKPILAAIPQQTTELGLFGFHPKADVVATVSESPFGERMTGLGLSWEANEPRYRLANAFRDRLRRFKNVSLFCDSTLTDKYGDARYWMSRIIMYTLRRSKEAIKPLREAIQRCPEDDWYRIDLGIALTRNGKSEDALELFDRITNPEVLETVPRFRARALIKTPRFLEAGSVVEELVTGDPENIWNWDIQGRFLSKGFDHRGALRSFTRAHDLDPDEESVMWQQTTQLELLHRWDEAIAIYERLDELADGDDESVYRHRSWCLYAAGREQEGLEMLEHGLERHPRGQELTAWKAELDLLSADRDGLEAIAARLEDYMAFQGDDPERTWDPIGETYGFTLVLLDRSADAVTFWRDRKTGTAGDRAIAAGLAAAETGDLEAVRSILELAEPNIMCNYVGAIWAALLAIGGDDTAARELLRCPAEPTVLLATWSELEGRSRNHPLDPALYPDVAIDFAPCAATALACAALDGRIDDAEARLEALGAFIDSGGVRRGPDAIEVRPLLTVAARRASSRGADVIARVRDLLLD